MIKSYKLTRRIQQGRFASLENIFKDMPTFIPKLKGVKPTLEEFGVESFVHLEECSGSAPFCFNILNVAGICFVADFYLCVHIVFRENYVLFVVYELL